MRVLKSVLVLSALVGTAACGSESKRPAAEDLSWLDTVNLRTPPAQAVVSPVELGLLHTPHDSSAEVARVATREEPAEVEKPEPRSSSTRSSARRSRSSRSGSASRSGGSGGGEVYSAPAPRARTVEVKHTKRDAVIGAAAGGVIGAVAGGPRHRVKGAVIGAAVGGIAGAVIGNNVDKSRRVVYDH